MELWTKEANENAVNKLSKLYVKLAETKPTEQWLYSDIVDLMWYVETMKNDLERRIRKMNKFNRGDIVTIRGESELARVSKIICDGGKWFYEVEAVELEHVPTREVKEEDLRSIKSRIIIQDDDTYRYFDKDGNELNDGDVIQFSSGSRETLYLTDNNRLGTDATNPKWIESGRAVPLQFGIYPLERSDLEDCRKVNL